MPISAREGHRDTKSKYMVDSEKRRYMFTNAKNLQKSKLLEHLDTMGNQLNSVLAKGKLFL